MQLGVHVLRNGLFAAPMAGVTDRPFRTLCRRFGAGLAISEMVSSRPELRATRKSRLRLEHRGETGPVSVQIAGADPAMMADAARFNAAEGAQIIDINMGCPAKKVCNKWAGSALLVNENLVAAILDAVVAAVDVPVTLKFRTGWDPEHRNAVRVAQLAERAGVQLLTLHGRTRACGFKGHAEYATIRAVCEAVAIPVVANGDIDSPAKARAVLTATGAAALMIGRAAQGRPWIFREIAHHLATGSVLPPPRVDEARELLLAHLEDHYAFYGEFSGLRTARKHIIWYTRGLAGSTGFRQHMNTLDTTAMQMRAVTDFFMAQGQLRERLEYQDPPRTGLAANDEPTEALAA